MSTPRPVHSVSTTELYNRWATVYDTDGNILQALDDEQLPFLLAQLFNTLQSPKPNASPASLTITELGAGTGRNTVKLLSPTLRSDSNIGIKRVNALDLSPAMLDVARERCAKSIPTGAVKAPEVRFYEYDALSPSKFPDVEKEVEGKADIVLSTLVLEHLPLDVFFATAKALLKAGAQKEGGGYLVLTNMHAEMGRLGQAGFVDEETGEKVRGESFVHEIGEVVEEGRKWGFVLDGEVRERVVRECDVGEDPGEERVLGRRGRKWIGVKVWFGMVLRLV